MQGGNYCTPPRLPHGPVCRDEPLAHDKVQDLRKDALGVVGCIGDQNVPGYSRLGHYHKALGPKAQPKDAPVCPRQPDTPRDILCLSWMIAWPLLNR